MKKPALSALIGISILSACRSAIPIVTATLTTVPTGIVIPTETSMPAPVNEPTPTLEAISGGWSTFHSQEYGFQFLYPAVYDKGFYDPVDPLSFCNIQEKKEDSKFNIWVGYVWLVVDKTNQSLESIADDYVREKSIDWDIRSQIQGKIDGLPSITVEYDSKRPSRWGSRTLLVHNNYLFTIDYYETNFAGCGPLNTGYSSYWVYEQMIKTLKFDH